MFIIVKWWNAGTEFFFTDFPWYSLDSTIIFFYKPDVCIGCSKLFPQPIFLYYGLEKDDMNTMTVYLWHKQQFSSLFLRGMKLKICFLGNTLLLFVFPKLISMYPLKCSSKIKYIFVQSWFFKGLNTFLISFNKL